MIKSCTIKDKIIGEGRPKICVPIVGRTRDDIVAAALEIKKESSRCRIDVVEFRADFFEKLYDFDSVKDIMVELKRILDGMVLLFTIRSEAEGGEKLAFSTPDIISINSFVISNRLADMVDVELFSGDSAVDSQIKLARENDVKIIMSSHDFKTTPDEQEIINRLCRMQDMGADIAKIAVMPEDEKQLVTLLHATVMMQQDYARIPIVTISMGRLGAISRVTGKIFGSAMTFAAVQKTSAPGQLSVEEVNKIIDII